MKNQKKSKRLLKNDKAWNKACDKVQKELRSKKSKVTVVWTW